MKLRNKRTGEIKEWDFGNWYQHILNPDNEESYECTLSEFIDRTAEFREEWEDVPEEPKKYYYITSCGETTHRGYRLWENESIYDKNRKQIGNYFGTEEEAEQAVEKLKAWKRLKDKGFRFNGYSRYDWNGNKSPAIAFEYSDFNKLFDDGQVVSDLDLLFGGEQ